MIREASSPAVKAPMKAAAVVGMPVRSTSSRRRVLESAPITAAIAAILTGLLNMMENPKTPQKLVSNRKIKRSIGSRLRAVKFNGCRCSSNAIIHAVIVATSTMIIE